MTSAGHLIVDYLTCLQKLIWSNQCVINHYKLLGHCLHIGNCCSKLTWEHVSYCCTKFLAGKITWRRDIGLSVFAYLDSDVMQEILWGRYFFKKENVDLNLYFGGREIWRACFGSISQLLIRNDIFLPKTKIKIRPRIITIAIVRCTAQTTL